MDRRPTECRVLKENDALDGSEVLPKFALPLLQLFGYQDQQVPSAT
jgi:hypothetical protein